MDNILVIIFLILSTSVFCEDNPITFQQKTDENGANKKNEKRSLYGLGYGYSAGYGSIGDGAFDYGAFGGYGLSSSISFPSQSNEFSAASNFPTSIHTTITKHVAVPVPQPIAVPVEKHVPYPVAAPYPIEIPRPYPVTVSKPVPIPFERPYPIPIDKPYPIAIPQPVAVPIYKHIPVSESYPIAFSKPYIQHLHINKPIFAHPSW